MRYPVPVRPAACPVYNSGSAVDVPYVSRSRQLAEVAPTSTRYRIDDLTNSRVVQDWAAIAPSVARGVLVVSAALNAMHGEFSALELRQVTFEFTTAGVVRQELAYYELARVFQGATS